MKRGGIEAIVSPFWWRALSWISGCRDCSRRTQAEGLCYQNLSLPRDRCVTAHAAQHLRDAIERLPKISAGGAKSHAEVRRYSEAVAGRQKHALACRFCAEWTCVCFGQEPGEGNHPCLRRNPA